MQRRNRLSRSRDFDAVYRQGRSVSNRYLTLHWFTRDDASDEPRLGLAIPKTVGTAVERNRLKRQLRHVWRELAADADRGRDYVLVARTGLAEPAATRGLPWLAEQVGDVIAQTATGDQRP